MEALPSKMKKDSAVFCTRNCGAGDVFNKSTDASVIARIMELLS
jgi:hypothetical protein